MRKIIILSTIFWLQGCKSSSDKSIVTNTHSKVELTVSGKGDYLFVKGANGGSIRLPRIKNKDPNEFSPSIEKFDFKGLDSIKRAEFINKYMTTAQNPSGKCKDVTRTVEIAKNNKPGKVIYSQTSAGVIMISMKVNIPQNPANVAPSESVEVGSIRIPKGPECGDDWKSQEDLSELTTSVDVIFEGLAVEQMKGIKLF
jgi:hypothetical protein